VVKGKTAGLMIYELIAAGSQAVRTDRVERYEHSFALYQRADFKGALALLDQQSDDPPSVVLSGRCQDFIAHPPPDSWDGVHAFDVK
jgi:hypothetical protein